jgi:hypothetical protein
MRYRADSMRLRSLLQFVSFPGVLALALVLASCATGEKKNQASRTDAKDAPPPDDDEPSSVSASRTTLVQSMSNSSLTNRTISRQKADEQAARLEPQRGGKEKRVLEGLLSAQRLSGKPVGDIMSTARAIADVEMRRSVDREISDDVKLEIAIGAVQQQKFALAEYFLSQLTASKDAKVRAGAWNLVGLIAIRQDRIPEAAFAFRESLKANGSYRAAQLNLGFLALRGGDFALAKRMLGEMQDDWFALSGLVIVERMEGDKGRADNLCEKVLDKRGDHKPTLFNCALHEYQGKRNFDKAKELLTRMTRARAAPGSERWDEKAFRLIGEIDMEKAREQKPPPAETPKPAPAK